MSTDSPWQGNDAQVFCDSLPVVQMGDSAAQSAPELPPQVLATLCRLGTAWRWRQERGPGEDGPAISLEEMASAGVALAELGPLLERELLCRTGPDFLLTARSMALVSRMAAPGSGEANPAAVRCCPCWARQPRQLLVSTVVVKVLLSTASTEMALLDAFEKEGWPRLLSNPLIGPRRVRTRKLREGARNLSCCQRCRLLAFRVVGGECLIWDYLG
jgi:hypothetical protein